MLRKILSIFTFIGGAIFGLAFAQRQGSDLRDKIAKSLKKGEIGSMLSKEAYSIGKDVWKSALGMKDVKEVQEFIGDAQTSLTELSRDAKSYGGEVAGVLAKKYAEISKDLGKEAKELQKAATKNVKKQVRKVARKIKKATAPKKVVQKTTKKTGRKTTTKRKAAAKK